MDIPFIDLKKSPGTGIPFVDFDYNNPKPAPSPTNNSNDPYFGSLYYDSNAGVIGKFTDTGYQQAYAGDSPGRANEGAYSSGGGGASYNPNDLAYLDSQQSLYERLLQSADGALNSGLQKLNDSTTSARNQATLKNSRAMRDYETKRTDTQNSKNQALGSVNTNARTLSDSLRRMLGMASGSGSSAYQITAPNAVARQASQQRNSVMSNYGQNERDIDTAVGDTKVDFTNLLQEIANQRRQREEELRAGVYGQQQGINQSLAEIASERARLQGGNSLSAMRPYQDRYLGLQTQIDQLPTQFRTDITSRDLNVKTPNLRDYMVDRQAINANRQGQSQYSPYSQFLRKDEEEQLA